LPEVPPIAKYAILGLPATGSDVGEIAAFGQQRVFDTTARLFPKQLIGDAVDHGLLPFLRL
jgi:hypothetical protein